MSLRCAYCHGPGGALTACAACGTQLHADCWSAAAGCPTLGCARAGVVPARPAAKERRLWAPGLLSCFAMAFVPFAPWLIWRRVGAPTIEVRNDAGRTLRNVRLGAFQLDAGDRVAEREALEPGESLTVSGTHTDYELSLQSVQFEGGGPKRLPWGIESVPWQRSLYAIDADGSLRTIEQASWLNGAPHPCRCPHGNVTGAGSTDCQISSHRPTRQR